MSIRKIETKASFLDGIPGKPMPAKFVKKDVSQIKTREDLLEYRAQLLYFWKTIPQREAMKMSQDIGDRFDALDGKVNYIKE